MRDFGCTLLRACSPCNKTVIRCMRQALTGAVVTVETLDGRTLSIPSPGVLAAGAVLRVADEGIAGKVR